MPTNRTRRTRKSNGLIVPAALKYFFQTGSEDQSSFPESERFNEFLFFNGGGLPDVIEYWRACRSDLLTAWTKNHPCSRPWAWWKFDAPNEPRLRLGGTGDTFLDSLSVKKIPTSWVTEKQVEYYNGRARDIHGNRIEKWPSGYYEDGSFTKVAINPDDPPSFESEAAYLQRHGLLTPSEKKWLTDHPEAMDPEKVMP